MKSLSHVQLFATPWIVTYQAPPTMGFSGQECWSGLPFPSPGDLPDPGMEPALKADASPSEPRGKPAGRMESKTSFTRRGAGKTQNLTLQCYLGVSPSLSPPSNQGLLSKMSLASSPCLSPSPTSCSSWSFTYYHDLWAKSNLQVKDFYIFFNGWRKNRQITIL